MGLLSRMEAIRARDLELKNSSSLYGSKQKITNYHSFSKKVSLRQSAVLVPFGKRFFMRYEHGFDADSIFKSVSSVDFWNGTIPQRQQWYTVTKENLEPFYQLFSDDIVGKLTHLHIKSFTILADVPIKAIIIATDEEIDQELISNYIPDLADFIAADISNSITNFSAPIFSSSKLLEEKLSSSLPNKGKLFTLSIKEAVAEIADIHHADTETLEILDSVLLFEVYNRIRGILSSEDFCFPENDHEVSIFFSSAENIDADLLQFHLQRYLAPFFGNSSANIFLESKDS